ncbi:hypothetical protein DIPPA_23840 [Diplonema papillatum]|nr:hypothetical protein DIPPA_23840 [Diplonema papillatum]
MTGLLCFTSELSRYREKDVKEWTKSDLSRWGKDVGLSRETLRALLAVPGASGATLLALAEGVLLSKTTAVREELLAALCDVPTLGPRDARTVHGPIAKALSARLESPPRPHRRKCKGMRAFSASTPSSDIPIEVVTPLPHKSARTMASDRGDAKYSSSGAPPHSHATASAAADSLAEKRTFRGPVPAHSSSVFRSLKRAARAAVRSMSARRRSRGDSTTGRPQNEPSPEKPKEPERAAESMPNTQEVKALASHVSSTARLSSPSPTRTERRPRRRRISWEGSDETARRIKYSPGDTPDTHSGPRQVTAQAATPPPPPVQSSERASLHTPSKERQRLSVQPRPSSARNSPELIPGRVSPMKQWPHGVHGKCSLLGTPPLSPSGGHLSQPARGCSSPWQSTQGGPMSLISLSTPPASSSRKPRLPRRETPESPSHPPLVWKEEKQLLGSREVSVVPSLSAHSTNGANTPISAQSQGPALSFSDLTPAHRPSFHSSSPNTPTSNQLCTPGVEPMSVASRFQENTQPAQLKVVPAVDPTSGAGVPSLEARKEGRLSPASHAVHETGDQCSFDPIRAASRVQFSRGQEEADPVDYKQTRPPAVLAPRSISADPLPEHSAKTTESADRVPSREKDDSRPILSDLHTAAAPKDGSEDNSPSAETQKGRKEDADDSVVVSHIHANDNRPTGGWATPRSSSGAPFWHSNSSKGGSQSTGQSRWRGEGATDGPAADGGSEAGSYRDGSWGSKRPMFPSETMRDATQACLSGLSDTSNPAQCPTEHRHRLLDVLSRLRQAEHSSSTHPVHKNESVELSEHGTPRGQGAHADLSVESQILRRRSSRCSSPPTKSPQPKQPERQEEREASKPSSNKPRLPEVLSRHSNGVSLPLKIPEAAQAELPRQRHETVHLNCKESSDFLVQQQDRSHSAAHTEECDPALRARSHTTKCSVSPIHPRTRRESWAQQQDVYHASAPRNACLPVYVDTRRTQEDETSHYTGSPLPRRDSSCMQKINEVCSEATEDAVPEYRGSRTRSSGANCATEPAIQEDAADPNLYSACSSFRATDEHLHTRSTRTPEQARRKDGADPGPHIFSHSLSQAKNDRPHHPAANEALTVRMMRADDLLTQSPVRTSAHSGDQSTFGDVCRAHDVSATTGCDSSCHDARTADLRFTPCSRCPLPTYPREESESSRPSRELSTERLWYSQGSPRQESRTARDGRGGGGLASNFSSSVRIADGSHTPGRETWHQGISSSPSSTTGAHIQESTASAHEVGNARRVPKTSGADAVDVACDLGWQTADTRRATSTSAKKAVTHVHRRVSPHPLQARVETWRPDPVERNPRSTVKRAPDAEGEQSHRRSRENLDTAVDGIEHVSTRTNAPTCFADRSSGSNETAVSPKQPVRSSLPAVPSASSTQQAASRELPSHSTSSGSLRVLHALKGEQSGCGRLKGRSEAHPAVGECSSKKGTETVGQGTCAAHDRRELGVDRRQAQISGDARRRSSSSLKGVEDDGRNWTSPVAQQTTEDGGAVAGPAARIPSTPCSTSGLSLSEASGSVFSPSVDRYIAHARAARGRRSSRDGSGSLDFGHAPVDADGRGHGRHARQQPLAFAASQQHAAGPRPRSRRAEDAATSADFYFEDSRDDPATHDDEPSDTHHEESCGSSERMEPGRTQGRGDKFHSRCGHGRAGGEPEHARRDDYYCSAGARSSSRRRGAESVYDEDSREESLEYSRDGHGRAPQAQHGDHQEGYRWNDEGGAHGHVTRPSNGSVAAFSDPEERTADGNTSGEKGPWQESAVGHRGGRVLRCSAEGDGRVEALGLSGEIVGMTSEPGYADDGCSDTSSLVEIEEEESGVQLVACLVDADDRSSSTVAQGDGPVAVSVSPADGTDLLLPAFRRASVPFQVADDRVPLSIDIQALARTYQRGCDPLRLSGEDLRRLRMRRSPEDCFEEALSRRRAASVVRMP